MEKNERERRKKVELRLLFSGQRRRRSNNRRKDVTSCVYLSYDRASSLRTDETLNRNWRSLRRSSGDFVDRHFFFSLTFSPLFRVLNNNERKQLSSTFFVYFLSIKKHREKLLKGISGINFYCSAILSLARDVTKLKSFLCQCRFVCSSLMVRLSINESEINGKR